MAVRINANAEKYTASTGFPSPGSVFTVTCWMYLYTNPGGQTATWYLSNGGSFSCLMIDPNPFLFGQTGNGSSFPTVGYAGISVGQWYGVGLSINGPNARIVRVTTPGGSSTTATSSSFVPPSSYTALNIGGKAGTNFSDIKIASFKVWGTQLDQAQMEAELTQYDPIITTNLVRVHHFLVAETTDYSGNGFTLSGGDGATTDTGPSGVTEPVTAVEVTTNPGIIDIVGPSPTITFENPSIVVDTQPGFIDVVPSASPEITKFANLLSGYINTTSSSPNVAKQFNLDSPHELEIFGLTAVARGTNPFPGFVNIEGPPVRISFSVDNSAAQRGIPQAPWVPSTRFFAQSILTGEFIHMDLEISNSSITRTLSGPKIITGEFPTEIKDLRDVGLTPWGTWIHVEDNGVIIGSGILQPTQVERTGEKLSLEAIGASGYPIDLPFLGELSLINEDPANIVRRIWQHIQSFPDGNLGVVVRGSTPVRIGKPRPAEIPEGQEDTNPNDDNDKPYELLWWEAPDCGEEINKLITSTPMDFVEIDQWNVDKTEVLHYIDLAYPRVGRRRTDLTFEEGDNLIAGLGPNEEPGTYASQIHYFGKGEGRNIIRGYAGHTSSKNKLNRLRRATVIRDNLVDNTTLANSLSRSEYERRHALLEISEIEIDGRKPSAPLGSFIEGDDIFIEAEVPWIGEVGIWERIVNFTYSPDTESVAIQVRRSESFVYGAGSSFEEGLQ